MQLSDIPHMAQIASKSYFNTPLSAYISPLRHTYPEDFNRRFVQMIRARYYNPRSIGFVAVSASKPELPIAYAQFIRLGNDEAARRLIAAQRTVWGTVMGWVVGIWHRIENWVWPDRSVDVKAVGNFARAVEVDDKKFWESEEMKGLYGERWHAQSVVVSEGWRRRGIGAMLMGEVLKRAGEEGVVVGLEASEDGERLYRSLGFELRGRFSMLVADIEGGGIMMWRPKGE